MTLKDQFGLSLRVSDQRCYAREKIWRLKIGDIGVRRVFLKGKSGRYDSKTEVPYRIIRKATSNEAGEMVKAAGLQNDLACGFWYEVIFD